MSWLESLSQHDWHQLISLDVGTKIVIHLFYNQLLCRHPTGSLSK